MHFLRTRCTRAMVSSGRTALACLEGLDPQSVDLCQTQALQGEENCVPLCKSPAHNHLALSKNLKTAHVLGASTANKLATLAAVMPPQCHAESREAATATCNILVLFPFNFVLGALLLRNKSGAACLLPFRFVSRCRRSRRCCCRRNCSCWYCCSVPCSSS